ncbi:hypothetical protein BSKO_10499 [Bryopsis sp. KO-2023]|nr:hypothetical protein BSKO_10499 [Bryopsis sp. KO-2023]
MRAGRVFAGRPVPVSLIFVAARPGWFDRTSFHASTCRVVDPVRCFLGKSVRRSRAKRGPQILKSASSVEAARGSTKIPVEPSQFLGLQPGERHPDTDIKSAHDELSDIELEPGYSVATVEGRLEVLDKAKKDSMKSSKTFKAPKDPPDGVTVENRLVPSALALLCQVGEYEVLIDIGEKFLEIESNSQVHNDINLAMGFAKLGQAEEIFNIPKASTACLKMEEAHRLLAETGSSPAAAELINGIEECLIDIAPRSVKQQLMLPLSVEHEQDREDAIEILKDLLAPPGKSSKRLFDRPVDRHFVKEALDRMTSQEILNLTDWAPRIREPKSTPWFYPGLLLKVTMAHIVVAFMHRRPSLLLELDEIFSIPGKEREAHVERVVCHVLLGEPDKAIALLKKIEGNSNDGKSNQVSGFMARLEGSGDSGKQSSVVAAKELPARNETLTFIKANSPVSKDGKQESLLAGLCLFTERWLARIAMPHFRDTCDRLPPPSLHDYFHDEAVSEFLKTRGVGSPLDSQELDLVLEEEEEEEEYEGSASESVEAEADSEGNDADSKETPVFQVNKKSKKASKQKKKSKKSAKKIEETAIIPAIGNPSRKKPNPILVALTGGAILGAALFAYVYQPWVVEDEYENLTEAQQTTMNKLTAENPMTITMADNLVKKWQFAKSKALGPEHEIKFIGKILSPELLETWKERVNDVVEQRLYWTYKVSKCKVSDVDSSKFDGGFGHISIHAQLSESATMHDAKGRALDKYKTSYKVVYEVLLDTEGKWRIKQINVLRQ